MKSLINELLITYHKWRIEHSSSVQDMCRHWELMRDRINNRSQKQIERMEIARGIK